MRGRRLEIWINCFLWIFKIDRLDSHFYLKNDKIKWMYNKMIKINHALFIYSFIANGNWWGVRWEVGPTTNRQIAICKPTPDLVRSIISLRSWDVCFNLFFPFHSFLASGDQFILYWLLFTWCDGRGRGRGRCALGWKRNSSSTPVHVLLASIWLIVAIFFRSNSSYFF